jgi:hypothetical protein
VFDALSGVDDFSDLILAASGSGDTLITWGTDDSILVQGVKPHQLNASDFEFGSPAAALDSVAASLAHGSAFGHATAMDHAASEMASQSMALMHG